MSITKKANPGRDELIALLKEAKGKSGYLSKTCLAEIAQSLDLPLSEVYGVASFYSFLSVRPQGRNVIRICKSVPCYLKGSEMIIESVKKELGIGPGESSLDGRFSFELTNCIGACDKAPAMMVNSDVYGGLTPAKITEVLKDYR